MPMLSQGLQPMLFACWKHNTQQASKSFKNGWYSQIQISFTHENDVKWAF